MNREPLQRNLMRIGFWLPPLVLGGCSMIADLFPDKQKQYQYHSEIPALEVPPDLSISTVTGSKWRRPAEGEETGAANAAASPVTKSSGESGDSSQAILAQNTEDVPLIEISAPFADAWSQVGRALGRMKIEVSDQNRSDGIYYVYYGGSRAKAQSQDMWDDIKGLFAGDSDGSKEYRLKLEEHKTGTRTGTDVFLFDDQGEPIRQGPPLDLLKKLHRELQTMSSTDGDDEDRSGQGATGASR